MELTITVEDVDKGIEKAIGEKRLSRVCAITQAARKAFPKSKNVASCMYFFVIGEDGGEEYRKWVVLPEEFEKANRVVSLFDSKSYDALKQILPLTLNYTRTV